MSPLTDSGSTTTSILAKAVERRTGFLPIFLMICQFVFPDRVICVFCKKILCLRAKDFFAIASSEGRRKIAPQINSGDGVKKLSFLIASNLKTIFADFP